MIVHLKFEHPNYLSTGIIRDWMPPFVYYPNKTKIKEDKKKNRFLPRKIIGKVCK